MFFKVFFFNILFIKVFMNFTVRYMFTCTNKDVPNCNTMQRQHKEIFAIPHFKTETESKVICLSH